MQREYLMLLLVTLSSIAISLFRDRRSHPNIHPLDAFYSIVVVKFKVYKSNTLSDYGIKNTSNSDILYYLYAINYHCPQSFASDVSSFMKAST